MRYTVHVSEEVLNHDRVVDDGFGNLWGMCDRPDCSLQVVRPGSVQCDDYMVEGPNGVEWVSPCVWGNGEVKTNV